MDITEKLQSDKSELSRFKDVRGRWLTGALFWETRKEGYTPLWTKAERAKTVDGVTYPSFKEMYLEAENPNEYLFVTKTLGTSLKHWEKLQGNLEIKSLIDECREELVLLLQAKGTASVIEKAGEGNFQAAKTLMDRGWMSNEKKPMKEKVQETKTEFENSISSFLESRESMRLN